MRWKSINTPLGQCDCPFGVSKKCGSFPIFGDMLDYWNNAETNDYNIQIARETNEANAKINQEQLAWAREQYESEKAENRFLVNQAYERELENRQYNSPEELKRRYIAAGINPYLAMSQGGGVGSHSVVNPSTGQNPHANQPNMIPMQTGSPHVPYTGFGQGINNAMLTALEFMNNERQDYALASQIDVQFMNARANLIEAAASAKNAGVNESWINHQIADSNRRYFLDQDRFSLGVEEFRHNAEITSREQAVHEFDSFLNYLQTEENIRLSVSQRRAISQSIQESIERVNSISHSDSLSEAEYNQKIVQTAIENLRADKELKMSEDMINSSVFRNYLDTGVNFLGTGLGVFLGMRGFSIANRVGSAGSKVLGKFEKTMQKYNKQYRKNVLLKKNSEYHSNFGYD